MALNAIRSQIVHDTPHSWWRGNRPAGRQAIAELAVDGKILGDYFSLEPYPASLGVLTIPYGKEDLSAHTGESEILRTAFDARNQHPLLDWAGIAALLGDVSTFPLGKLPLLTCCGDELCGFTACTVSYNGASLELSSTVTWHDFGHVYPIMPTLKESWLYGEKWDFIPTKTDLTFTFRADEYLCAIRELLRLDTEIRISETNRSANRIVGALKRWFGARKLH